MTYYCQRCGPTPGRLICPTCGLDTDDPNFTPPTDDDLLERDLDRLANGRAADDFYGREAW